METPVEVENNNVAEVVLAQNFHGRRAGPGPSAANQVDQVHAC